MEEKKRRNPYLLVLIWLLIAIITLTGVTFAWFNFNASTNVVPNQGSTISDGAASLLISNSPNGPFEFTTTLIMLSKEGSMMPVSTNDLEKFFISAGQDTKGITILYKDATSDVDNYTMHGKVYLKSEGGDLDVFFNKPHLYFGDDTQALASMRLGLKITNQGSTETLIFNLDDIGGAGATKKVTVSRPGSVVSSISGGSPNYVDDSAKSIDAYSALVNGPDDKEPKAGANKLMTLRDEQVAEVEYWLYLEGCDENCFNDVQKKDVAVQFAFAGTDAAN